MKIAIIGAGSMGQAIAKGLAGSDFSISVSNPSPHKLEALKDCCPDIATTQDNRIAVKDADIVILAVKPWIVPTVIYEIKGHINPISTLVVSIAAGVDNEALAQLLVPLAPPTAYAIPNTAIAVGKGVTFISPTGCSKQECDLLVEIFSRMGEAVIADSKIMKAGTALCSCAIAYAYKFVQAYVQAGVQLGFRPAEALKYSIATVEGAMQLLKENHSLPQQEIDRVTTPGGMTIKGINELEHTGFTSSVISAILKPVSDN